MKVRTGFVSNSSSSSFVIWSKEELTKESLFKLMKVDEKSLFYKIAQDLCETIVSLAEEATEDSLKEEFGGLSKDDMSEDAYKLYKHWIKNDGYLYAGSACDEDDRMEALLRDIEIDYDSDDLIVKKEGGY